MFYGNNLKLIRNALGYSLDDVAQHVGKSRQFIHSLEIDLKQPNSTLLLELSMFFETSSEYFFTNTESSIKEEIVHFRKLKSTPQMMKAKTVARAEIIHSVVRELEEKLNFPHIDFPFYESDDIEFVAEKCREHWELGLSPITNMVRLAEKNGAIVINLSDISNEVDALSVATERPIILRNLSKKSPCRHRFDIAHEIGHLILHKGIVTGDKQTETEANRFASALLLPRQAMIKLFPRPQNNRIQWSKISEFKLQWKVSKAAIFYRAHQLGLMTDAQYKSAVITLRRTGEAITEREDYLIEEEHPTLLQKAVKVLNDENLEFISSKLLISNVLISRLLGLERIKKKSTEFISFADIQKNSQNSQPSEEII